MFVSFVSIETAAHIEEVACSLSRLDTHTKTALMPSKFVTWTVSFHTFFIMYVHFQTQMLNYYH